MDRSMGRSMGTGVEVGVGVRVEAGTSFGTDISTLLQLLLLFLPSSVLELSLSPDVQLLLTLVCQWRRRRRSDGGEKGGRIEGMEIGRGRRRKIIRRKGGSEWEEE